MGIVSTIIDSLSEFVTGSATAISTGIQGLFFTTGTDGAHEVSITGYLLFTMIAIGFGVGLIRLIINLVRK